jgi:D-lactate dehydrogenase (cytochrome)
MTDQHALSLLKARFGDQLSAAETVRNAHGEDEGHLFTAPPDAVLFAQTTADIVAAVKICAAHTMPIIPYGAGTSLEGQISAPNGGLSLDLSRMDKILALNNGDMDVRVEAGVRRKALNIFLRDQGLFMPVDPGADATLGGMVATRASGTNAVKYGTMREQILSLQVVTATGEIIETGTRARKSAAGYDLTHLFAGSEGTLGIISEITLKLHPIPEKISAGTCCFPSLEAAVNTVIAVIQSGLEISRIELVDALSIKAINAYSHSKLPEDVTLFLEFSGPSLQVAEDLKGFRALADDFSASAITFAQNTEEIAALWQARHQLYYATRALQPGCDSLTTDVCVPISQFGNLYA